MSIEKMRTPEEIAKIEKERALSDAELIKGGARYEVEKDGTKRLAPHIDQVEIIKEKEDSKRPMNEKEYREYIQKLYNETFEIAQRISKKEQRFRDKVKFNKKPIYNDLFELYEASKLPKTGAQILFEGQMKDINLKDMDEGFKVIHLNQKWKFIEEQFNEFMK